MSKSNNLGDFLTDVADAIRTKKGTSGTINAQDFSSEIASIPTGETAYTITPTLTNVSAVSGNPTKILANGNTTLYFTADTGASLPDNVSVTGATGTWTKSTGSLFLTNPTGNVLITITGTLGYDVSLVKTINTTDLGNFRYSLDNGSTWINMTKSSGTQTITGAFQIMFNVVSNSNKTRILIGTSSGGYNVLYVSGGGAGTSSNITLDSNKTYYILADDNG